MVAVVWGTKVRHASAGTTAIHCAACGGIRLADVLSVEQAQHIYYISGAYKEVSRYVRCRLCGSCDGMPDDAKVGPRKNSDQVEPDEEFLKKYHPALLGADSIEQAEVELPKGVTREQLALFQSMNLTADAIRNGKRVDENAGALIMIAVAVVGFGVVVSWGVFDRNLPMQIAGIGVSLLVGLLLAGLAWQWTKRLVVRGMDETLGPCVKRFVAFTKTSLKELCDISPRPDICGNWTRRYLQWLSARGR